MVSLYLRLMCANTAVRKPGCGFRKAADANALIIALVHPAWHTRSLNDVAVPAGTVNDIVATLPNSRISGRFGRSHFMLSPSIHSPFGVECKTPKRIKPRQPWIYGMAATSAKHLENRQYHV